MPFIYLFCRTCDGYPVLALKESYQLDHTPSFKKDWVLTQDALDRLHSLLDADRERAAAKYKNLHRKLTTFFECRGCHTAEDCADIAMNRGARRLIEGVEIYA